MCVCNLAVDLLLASWAPWDARLVACVRVLDGGGVGWRGAGGKKKVGAEY